MKILVRGVNWIGDAMMTTPALRQLRRHLPNASISLVLRPWLVPLFSNNPDIDEVIAYGDEFRGVRGRLQFAKELTARRFDMAVLFQNAIDAAIITWLAQIPKRIGYSTDVRGFLLTTAIKGKRKDPGQHHVYYYLELLKKGLAIDYNDPEMVLVPGYDVRKKAKKLLTSFEPHCTYTIGINPGATYGSAKRWMPERFAVVADRAVEKLNGRVILFGSKQEAPIAEAIIRAMKHKALNMVGNTDLPLLSAFLYMCDAMVTNDSGPMHMAAALNTPVVAVFGSTNSVATGPFGKGHRVVKKEMPCSPCLERVCPNGSLACMDAISAKEVSEALDSVILGKKAVFFDRDGTLIRDAHYLNSFDNFYIFPDAKSSLNRLDEAGFMLIGVSNQSGIARGIVDEEFVRQCHKALIEKLPIEAFYFCPHHPDDRCTCRKPEIGLLKKAALVHGLDLKKSYVVGDKESDILLAKAVSSKGVLISTGQEQSSSHADYIVSSLTEAADWILKDYENTSN